MIKKITEKIKNRKLNFLIVGKLQKREIDENEKDNIKEILTELFGPKSDIITNENMKKIESVLCSNNIINDKVIFPCEIYK